MIISLGIQCTNGTFKKEINKTCKTLPFDWMFAHPKFVYEMLVLLLEKDMDVKELVINHFFLCDKKASYKNIEHYITDENGTALYNSKYT